MLSLAPLPPPLIHRCVLPPVIWWVRGDGGCAVYANSYHSIEHRTRMRTRVHSKTYIPTPRMASSVLSLGAPTATRPRLLHALPCIYLGAASPHLPPSICASIFLFPLCLSLSLAFILRHTAGRTLPALTLDWRTERCSYNRGGPRVLRRSPPPTHTTKRSLSRQVPSTPHRHPLRGHSTGRQDTPSPLQ